MEVQVEEFLKHQKKCPMTRAMSQLRCKSQINQSQSQSHTECYYQDLEVCTQDPKIHVWEYMNEESPCKRMTSMAIPVKQ